MNREEQANYAGQVRAAMVQRGWSNARLAKESTVSENTIADFLTGRKQTQPSKVRQILRTLGVPETDSGAFIMEGVPEDVRVFATVAVQKLSALDEAERLAALGRLYPQLLLLTDRPPDLEVTREAEDLAPTERSARRKPRQQ